MVNIKVKLPYAPGPWVNKERCQCGATYKDFRTCPGPGGARTLFGLAALELRWASQSYERKMGIGDPDDPPGGFRSRRAVLWMMRCIKMRDWYQQHADCQGSTCQAK